MAELSWDNIPTLAVGHILQYLNLKDALAASSTCRSWRSALRLYDAHSHTVKLIARADRMDINLFHAQLSRKHVKSLCIVLDCGGSDLENFANFVLYRFCESRALYEIGFLATAKYLELEEQIPTEKLRSLLTEKLIHNHRFTLEKITFFGCGNLLPQELEDSLTTEDKHYKKLNGLMCTTVKDYELSLSSYTVIRPYHFFWLEHLCMDYNSVDSDFVEGLANLPHLSQLVLNVVNVPDQEFKPVNWMNIYKYYELELEVTLNIISVPSHKLDNIVEHVLVPVLPLVALRVFFCKAFHLQLIKHVSEIYRESLRELQWTDAPFDDNEEPHTILLTNTTIGGPEDISPFVLVCWQCNKLEKLVVHGYWVSAYDLLGMARLRYETLRCLEISAVMYDIPEFSGKGLNDYDNDTIMPVYKHEQDIELVDGFVKQMNGTLMFHWKQIRWINLHKALGVDSCQEDRYSYVLRETSVEIVHMGVTSRDAFSLEPGLFGLAGNGGPSFNQQRQDGAMQVQAAPVLPPAPLRPSGVLRQLLAAPPRAVLPPPLPLPVRFWAYWKRG